MTCAGVQVSKGGDGVDPWYPDQQLLNAPPPDAPCLVCQAYTPRASVNTPHGLVWQCRRCLTPVESENYAFDPRRVPQGREEGTAAILVLQQLVVGLRHSQDGPVDPEDLYELCRPYFTAGWCVRDLIHALNQLPNGTTHPDTGWTDRLPRKQLLYRVLRRLREWRWVDRDSEDDIMPGGWTEMRRAMRVAAQRQADHAMARAAEWTQQRDAAAQSVYGYGRQAARMAAMSAASRARIERAQGEKREQQAAAEAAREARQARTDLQQRLEAFERRQDDDGW